MLAEAGRPTSFPGVWDGPKAAAGSPGLKLQQLPGSTTKFGIQFSCLRMANWIYKPLIPCLRTLYSQRLSLQ